MMRRSLTRRHELLRFISSGCCSTHVFRKRVVIESSSTAAPFSQRFQIFSLRLPDSSRFFSSEGEISGVQMLSDHSESPTAVEKQREPSSFVRKSLLDRDARPLGTYTWEDWEAGLFEFTSCLDLPPTDNDSMGSPLALHSFKDENWAGIGTRILEAEKLLERFFLEALTQSFVARKFLKPQDILLMSIATLESWIRINQQYPGNSSTLKFSLSRLKWIVWELPNLKRDGAILDSDSSRAIQKVIVELVHECINLKTSESVERCAEILCSQNTLELFRNDPETLVLLFQEMAQQLRNVPNSEPIADMLSSHLSEFSSTSTIEPQQSAPAVVDEGSDSSPLTQDESEALLQQLLVRVANATEKDITMEREVAASVKLLYNESMQAELSLTFAEYFIRMGDVSNATFWIGRIRPEIMATYENRGSELLGKSIVLWVKRKDEDPSVLYRAEEVLSLFEKISKLNGHLIDDRLYVALAKSMLSINDVWNLEKAANIALRPERPSSSLLFVALEAISKATIQNQDQMLRKAHFWFQELLESMSPEQAKNAGEILMTNLAGVGMIDESLDVFSALVERDVAVAPYSFESICSNVKQPHQRADIFQQAVRRTGTLAPQHALGFLKSIEPDKSGSHLDIFSNIFSFDFLSRAVDDEIFSEIVVAVVEKLLSWNEPNRAVDFIEMIENHLMERKSSRKIPLNCYLCLITGLINSGKRTTASVLFRRLRTGKLGSLPNSDFCSQYCWTMRGTLPWLIKECSDILEWLVKIYKETGDATFKPKSTLYTKMLYLLYLERDNDDSVPKRAQRLIMEMVDLNAHDGNNEPFRQAMQIACKLLRKDRFEMAYKIYRTMEATEGIEVNTEILNKLLWTGMFYRHIGVATNQLQNVLDYFENARHKGIVSEQSYSLILQAIDRLADVNTKEMAIERMFCLCCSDGFLDNQVKSQIREMVSEQVWFQLYGARLGNGNVEPKDWSRNVTGGANNAQQRNQQAF